MSDLGFGVVPFGGGLYGYGSPATINSTTAKLFKKADGTYGNVAMIDPVTQDYILDANGNNVGDDSINQMVYLALLTQLNSSSVPDFGLDLFSIKVITSNIELQVQENVTAALANLVSGGFISVQSISVLLIKQTGLQVIVIWTDLTNNEQNIFRFQGA